MQQLILCFATSVLDLAVVVLVSFAARSSQPGPNLILVALSQPELLNVPKIRAQLTGHFQVSHGLRKSHGNMCHLGGYQFCCTDSTVMQLLAYIRVRYQVAKKEGVTSSDGLSLLMGNGTGEIADFMKYNVSIHSVITGRIDQLRPSQQLTLKAGSFSLIWHFWTLSDHC